MLICEKVSCGSIADWVMVAVSTLAAAATLAAVIVALRESRHGRLAAAKAEGKLLATRLEMAQHLAIAFDYELYLLEADASYAADSMESLIERRKLGPAYKIASDLLSWSHLPLLDRFADRLLNFESETSGKLLIALSRWQSVRNGPAPTHPADDGGAFMDGTQGLIESLRKATKECRDARDAIAPLLPRGESTQDDRTADMDG
jgi:hypothetical protein